MAAALLTILYAEDDGLIAEPVVTALEDAGFEVLTARDASAAFALVREQIHNIAALITDINLGQAETSGWDVARLARELKPTLPVVYASGNVEADWAAYGVPNSIFVAKPFVPAQLVVAVSTLLNTGTGSTS